jgi:hypothetical protein
MQSAGAALLGACVLGICLLAGSHAAGAPAHAKTERRHPRVTTDGRLRPGHLETLHLSGFPGEGVTEVAYFPTAICEDECGARSFRGGRTNSQGAATFRVHVPGTFIDHRGHPVYFRDGERIDVEVTWEGPGNDFAVASPDPDPIVVRTHTSAHG